MPAPETSRQPVIRDVMTTPVLTVGLDTPVADVARLLTEHQISGVPVVDDGNVVGVISEGDLLYQKAELHAPVYVSLLDAVIPLGQTKFGEELQKLAAATAGELMSHPAIVIVPEATVTDAATRMLEHSINRLPVVDGHGHLVGIVARRDLIRTIADRG